MPKRKATQQDHQQRVRAVLAYIRKHPGGDLTLTQLAETAAQSPFHFTRVFQQQTGVGAMQHVRHFRLVQAAIALQTSHQKIVDIAMTAGYANHESFSRAFRRYFGLAPSAFRDLHEATNQPQEGQPMFKASIKLVKIPVTDFNAATQYYREVVGLEEEFAVEAYGWAQYKTGDVPLCLYVVGMGGGEGTPGTEVGFHLAVENIKTVYDGIQARGGQFASEIVGSDDGGMFFVLQDPDGNTFKVVQRVGG